jgi:hypothetical protein
VQTPGFSATVTPSEFTLAPGAEQEFTVEFTRTTAPLSEWAIGSLTWADGSHTVRSPIALQPVAVSAPTEIHADASASGSQEFEVTPGFTGTLDTSVSGLVGVTPIADSVTTGDFDFNNPVADADTRHYAVVVAADTKLSRFSLDAVGDAADLDLFVYLDGEFVDLSASGAADEQVDLLAPAEGTYDVFVNGFATPGGSTSYGLANFVVGSGDLGNAGVTPDPVAVTTAVPVTLTAAWAGLDVAQRWLGVMGYEGSEDVTLLSIG